MERRSVYSVIAKARYRRYSGRLDERRDHSKPLAHSYMRSSRKFDNRHDRRAVEALPVEPRIQREMTNILGEKIKANSWVVGVKVFADHIWQRVQSGEYHASSIVGRGMRIPRVGSEFDGDQLFRRGGL